MLSGSIVGNVRDPGGAAVAQAKVRVTQADTNQTRQTVTNPMGEHCTNFADGLLLGAGL
jgi:hypothetical protein